MTKRNKIIYWIATGWLSLGMVSTAIVQLMHSPEEVTVIQNLGYPVYVLTILGVWKLLGVIAILMPGLPVLKEWAYAGFIFAMSGAMISHFAAGEAFTTTLPALLLLVLALISWHFRPATRKLVPINL